MKYKNYAMIYKIFREGTADTLKAVAESFFIAEPCPSRYAQDLALKAVHLMARSDGLTAEDIDKVFTAQGLV